MLESPTLSKTENPSHHPPEMELVALLSIFIAALLSAEFLRLGLIYLDNMARRRRTRIILVEVEVENREDLAYPFSRGLRVPDGSRVRVGYVR
jgi:hypothetical protein